MARMPYTNFHELNLDWIIKRVKTAYNADNPPPYPVKSVNGQTGIVNLNSDNIIDVESGIDLTDALRAKQNRPSQNGTAGQVLGLDNQLNPVWVTPQAGGVDDYDDLTDKPQINGVTLSGNKSSTDLGIIDDNAGGGDIEKTYSADYITSIISPIVEDIHDINDDLTSLDNKIDLVQSEFKNVIGFEYRTADTTTNSWRLAASGLAVQNNNYKFLKYKVVEGTKIYLKAAKNPLTDSATFQFQNNSSVSSTVNPYIIGSPYLLSYDNIIDVPAGATYLIISALKTDTITGVYNIIFDRPRYPINNFLAENNLIKHACNLISDMETALTDGYKILEFDIRCTFDNIPVLSHNATISAGGTTYTIADETYNTLKTADSSLVNLKEALYWCKTHNIIADIDVTKETYVIEDLQTVVNYIQVSGMNGRCFITAVADDIRKMLAINKNLCVAASTISTTAMVDALRDIVLTANLTFCTRDYRYVDQTFVEYVHSKGILMKTWTPDTVQDVETMFNYGADLIISNTVKPSDI